MERRSKASVAFQAIIALVAVGAVLKYAVSVVLPLTIAWFLSFVLGPAVNFMTDRKVPRAIAIFVVLILLTGISYVGVIFLHGRYADFAQAFPRYQQRFTELVGTLGAKLDLKWNPFTQVNWGQPVSRFLMNLTGSLIGILSKMVLVVVFLIFMLLGQPYFKVKVNKALSPERATQVTHMFTAISSQISRYLSVQFLISLSTGILVWLVLLLIGLDFAATWGSLAFFFNFIPTVGSILASIPPILLALVQFYPSIWPGVITLAAVLTIQMVIGNGIAPKVLGDSLNLNPVVVLLSLVFWGWLWGVVGALLSIPIACFIKIVCENIEELRPISIMMGSGKIYQDETGNSE
jgi:predicted PurR-regulated permease PerM